MNEMLCYIFSNLKSSEYALKGIGKILSSQAKFNKAVTLFAIVATLNVVVTEAELKRQKRKIDKMSKEIEELRHVKGD